MRGLVYDGEVVYGSELQGAVDSAVVALLIMMLWRSCKLVSVLGERSSTWTSTPDSVVMITSLQFAEIPDETKFDSGTARRGERRGVLIPVIETPISLPVIACEDRLGVSIVDRVSSCESGSSCLRR